MCVQSGFRSTSTEGLCACATPLLLDTSLPSQTDTHADTHRHTDTQRERKTHTHTDTQTHRHTDTQRERKTHTQTHTHTHTCINVQTALAAALRTCYRSLLRIIAAPLPLPGSDVYSTCLPLHRFIAVVLGAIRRHATEDEFTLVLQCVCVCACVCVCVRACVCVCVWL